MHTLIPIYTELHKHGKFPGYSIRPYLAQITELVMASGAETMLDYGCGGGKQYTEEFWHMLWGFKPTLYDPAVPTFHVKPNDRFDAVICTDVLEHVPLTELDAVIADLVRYARRWCFVSVCCRPARANKNFPDGRNAHVTIRPEEWWHTTLGAAFEGRAAVHLEFTP
jgi:Methyltransferase domain